MRLAVICSILTLLAGFVIGWAVGRSSGVAVAPQGSRRPEVAEPADVRPPSSPARADGDRRAPAPDPPPAARSGDRPVHLPAINLSDADETAPVDISSLCAALAAGDVFAVRRTRGLLRPEDVAQVRVLLGRIPETLRAADRIAIERRLIELLCTAKSEEASSGLIEAACSEAPLSETNRGIAVTELVERRSAEAMRRFEIVAFSGRSEDVSWSAAALMQLDPGTYLPRTMAALDAAATPEARCAWLRAIHGAITGVNENQFAFLPVLPAIRGSFARAGDPEERYASLSVLVRAVWFNAADPETEEWIQKQAEAGLKSPGAADSEKVLDLYRYILDHPN